MISKSQKTTLWLATVALLAALVIVLQTVSTIIPTTYVSITLALTPIIVGAALFGWQVGALLGFVFSAVVLIMGIAKGDLLPMLSFNWYFTVVICFVKGTAAGAVSGVLYRVLRKRPLLATFVASAATPIVNTGLYAFAMVTIFRGMLLEGANVAGQMVFIFLISQIALNFTVEFIVNMALGTTVARIIEIYRKKFAVKFK